MLELLIVPTPSGVLNRSLESFTIAKLLLKPTIVTSPYKLNKHSCFLLQWFKCEILCSGLICMSERDTVREQALLLMCLA